MPTDFPLWRLRPEEAARIIILTPTEHVPAKPGWHKREMRIRTSPSYKPRTDDIKMLDRAHKIRYWEDYRGSEYLAFPRIGVLEGPFRKDGSFNTPILVPNALGAERPREPWGGMYSRKQHDRDVEAFTKTKALLMENFILGQRGEGPYLDGVIFLKVDRMLDAEIDRCKNRLQLTGAILSAKKQAKTKADAKWNSIGSDEAVAMEFKKSGFTVRKIDREIGSHWEVQAK